MAIRPYYDDVGEILRHVDKLKEICKVERPGEAIVHEQIVSGKDVDFVHVPIVDCSVTDDETILELARELVGRVEREECLYVHCWGGHGRTGTVVCLMLHL